MNEANELWAHDAVGFSVRIVCGGEAAIDLIIEDMHPGIQEKLAGTGMESLLGKSLREYSGAHAVFEEWVEFLVRARNMPFLSPFMVERDSMFQTAMLQYLELTREWVITRIQCTADGEYAYISFIPLREYNDLDVMSQLMTLTLYRRMMGRVYEGGHWVIDCVNHTCFLSGKMAEMIGLPPVPSTVSLGRFLRYIHPLDRQEAIDILDNITAMVDAFENRLVLDDGTMRYAHSYATPVYDEDKKLSRIFGVSINVTEHVLNEKDLARSTARFDYVAKNSSELFFIMDHNGNYIYLSPNTEQLLGVNLEDMAGRRLGSLMRAAGNNEDTIAEATRLVLEKKSGQVECILFTAEGEARWYAFSIFPVVSGQTPEEMEVVSIGYDITEEIRYRETLEFIHSHDHMTGLYNRRIFWDTMRGLNDRDDKENYCLVVLDINGLRLANDVFGQSRGDQVIVDVAELLRRVFPENADIYRIDGNNFAVIAYNTDIYSIEEECIKINEFSLSTQDRMLPISVSWGAACRAEAESAQALFAMAEGRMKDNKLLQQRSARNDVISSLEEALRARNGETKDHIDRMVYMVSKVGRKLGLLAHDLDRLKLLARMHDIGKLGVPDHILTKPGKLDDKEWEQMRKHAITGYNIAYTSKQLAGIAQEILSHHERWDGTGYPEGRKEDEIPLLSQIIAVVDTYDVITHKRIYKSASSHQEAVEEIQRCSGTQFSPKIAKLFLKIFSELTNEDIRRFSGEA